MFARNSIFGLSVIVSFYGARADIRPVASRRIAMFFSAASLSGAFSGLLAAAIENMGGIGGKPGWAWIFILVGLLVMQVKQF